RNFRNVNIYSQNNIIDYPYFITVLKQTLMAVLAALTLSFIAFLLEAVSGKRPETAEEAGESATRAAPSGGVEEPSGSSFDDSAFTDEYGPSFFEEPDKGEAPGGDPEDFDFGDFGDFDDTGNGGDFGLEEGTEAEEDPLPDDFLDEIELELPEDKEEKAKTAGPEGLYSPRGNIGWEEYTKDRLASEIHRCAASEQDLTVLLAEWDEKVDCTEELFNSFAAEAVKFFNLKDLTFVKGKKGLSVIIPGADLKQGIRKAEEFHSRIIKALGDTSGVREGLRVGISSRSGRLIDAERLLFEAANALAKTSPPSPIVAFKSDPEKYRDFIRRENQ
ncbi:MAG: hypothetical protein LBQ44_10980, partial [Treponema sp.]|nr:hypothetical protein [Treponema sp.]